MEYNSGDLGHDGHAHVGMHGLGHHDPSSHKDHSPSLFKINDLKIGKTMPLHFPKQDASSDPPYFPKDKASSVLFSSKELPKILRIFSLTQDSPQAKDIEATLKTCESDPPIKGGAKICATSWESVLDFVHHVFGLSDSSNHRDNHVSLLTITYYTDHQKDSFQNYTILDKPKEILVSNMIGCHTKPYPYKVYFCHTHESGINKVYNISYGGEAGNKVEAIVVCHLNTSWWDPNNAAFGMLGIKPRSPVCHLYPPAQGNLSWVHSTIQSY